jgi:two-component system chemotaxis response regulator CheY
MPSLPIAWGGLIWIEIEKVKQKAMKSCLIVDDSKVIRMVAKKILQELDFETVEAEDGQVALDVCKSKMPDAVLLDWNMPVMDGIDFLKNLRQLPVWDGPVVVFCTTENDVNHIQEAMEAGANEYIMKPFDGEIIQTKFAQVGLL